MRYGHLFSGLQVGRLILKNRIIFLPISTNLAAVTGEVTPEFVDHYKRRAQGGAAIITLENMCIQFPEARHGATQPRIDDDSFIPGLSRVAYEIHRYGSLAFMELTHPGLYADLTLSEGRTPVAPSAVNLRKDQVFPEELTEEKIEEIADLFAQSALRARKAHFDGVEIEAAHGLLVNQFLSPLTNKRTDRYGGSLENRVRFARLILERILDVCGEDYTVTARIGAIDFVDGGISIEEGAETARLFGEMGYAAVHADVGFGSKEKRLEPMAYPEAWRGYLAAAFKKASVSVPVIAVGMIRNPGRAEEILEKGEADLIGLGRPLIADPDWPIKAQNDREKAIKRCIGCSECIKAARHEEGTAIRCGVNPSVGKLESDEMLLPIPHPKKVLIIGAGPTGLEAAVTLKKRGHHVTLWEKEKYIGGALKLGCVPPGKEKIHWLIEYYEFMLEDLKIPIDFEKTATVEAIKAFGPEVVLLSQGAEYSMPPIKGFDCGHVLSFAEVLKGDCQITNSRVVVGGGGLVGCETALYLREQGNEVTLVEMLPDVAIGMEPISRDYLLRELKEKGVQIKTSAPVREIKERSVWIGTDSASEGIPADYFVAAFGGRPDHALYNKLRLKYEVHLLGDAAQVGKIIDAVQNGYGIGKMI
ncbi:MAG: FAD-dependent oxidoreductase [Calditrichaeota bacterium]|nr:FAD-dependent oxidoreductase [Calditrichota bacterium]